VSIADRQLVGYKTAGPLTLIAGKARNLFAIASSEPSVPTIPVPVDDPYQVWTDAHCLVLTVEPHPQAGGAPAHHLPLLTQPGAQRSHASIGCDLLHPGTYRDMCTVYVAPAVISPRSPTHRAVPLATTIHPGHVQAVDLTSLRAAAGIPRQQPARPRFSPPGAASSSGLNRFMC